VAEFAGEPQGDVDQVLMSLSNGMHRASPFCQDESALLLMKCHTGAA
jgi:hypothetical protein